MTMTGRKKLLILLAVMVLVAVIACVIYFYQIKKPDQQHDTEEYDDSELSQEMIDSLIANYYLYSVNHPIEKAFFEDALREDGSTGAGVLLYSKYAELWKEEAETYSALIQSELSGDALASFQALLQTWENVNDTEIMTYAAIQEAIHPYGSIRAVNAARDTMEVYRAQALKLIAIYEEVMTGCGWSWRNQSQEGL